MLPAHRAALLLALAAALPACEQQGASAGSSSGGSGIGEVVEGTCQGATSATGFLHAVGCTADFEALASTPLDATLSGARSVKLIVDQADDDRIWFINTSTYEIHFAFASTHLSGGDLPVISSLADFNATEYYAPDRRFLLGAVTYYAGPKAWALEIAPYDTASATLIEKLHGAVKAAGFFGPGLYFHPTSDDVENRAAALPSSVPVITTAELYAGIDYQPLNLATAIGRLRFQRASDLESIYLSYQDLVVLDQAPNDISAVQGIITETFQTPLSHLNVLSRNRGTPNMGLRGALANAPLRALEGKLVRLTVGATEWSVTEVTAAEAEAFWAAHMPDPVTLPPMDFTVTGLHDVEEVTATPADGETLRECIKKAVCAYGGKAAHYSVLARTAGVPVKKAFAIPVYYYWQFMTENGFIDRVNALLADSTFMTDQATRAAALLKLRDDMLAAPVNAGLQALLKAKLDADFPGVTMRFRTSTNSEDLEGFPCAGCYESHTGDPSDWNDVLDAIRSSYASAWLFRTFEERTYYGVDHLSVGMALLVHHNFPDEEANGVAITANPFDASGLDPAFYVNVQYGGSVEVVHPVAGISSDELLYYFTQPSQPISYLSHSSLVPTGTTVLTASQLYALGTALSAIHAAFSPAYGPAAGNTGWYAMDVEFKLDDEAAPTEPATLYVKQARPYPKSGN